MKKNLYINSETGIYTWKTKSPFTWKDSVYIKMLLQIISIDHIYMTRLLRNKSHQKKNCFMNTFSRLLYLVLIILLAFVFIEGENCLNLRSRYNGGEIIVACMSASRNREFQQKLMVSLQTKEYLYDHENVYKILHTRPISTGFLPYLITMKLLYSPEQTLFKQF